MFSPIQEQVEETLDSDTPHLNVLNLSLNLDPTIIMTLSEEPKTTIRTHHLKCTEV